MSAAQILIELPRLSHIERREIVRRLIELEQDAQVLADSGQRANANFLLLDALESEEDAPNASLTALRQVIARLLHL